MENDAGVVSDEIVETVRTGTNMQRRKKRYNGTWLPVNPTTYPDSPFGLTWTEDTLTINAGSAAPGITTVKAIPLTLDETASVDANDPGVSLRDFVEGQDYICKRVVGNTWFNAPQGGSEIHLRSICCLALAVLPVDDESAQDQPSIDAVQWHPLVADNAQQPWFYRRTWQLGNPFVNYYPGTSSWYGGQTTQLDTKGTARRITKEQRLFLIAAAGILEMSAGEPEFDLTWTFGYDLRIFGAMRRSKNRSTFA